MNTKADNLRIAKKHNINIPQFLKINPKISKLDFEQLIEKLDENVTYAVRSSANVEDMEQASFAGIFESYLNIRKCELYKYYYLCQKSVNSKKSIEYSKRIGVKLSEIKMYVIIQKMIDSDISGVVFTASPIDETDGIYIECIRGLGELLVSGKIEGDKIYIGNNNKKIEYILNHQGIKMNCKKHESGVEETNIPILDQSKHKLDFSQIDNILTLCKVLKQIFQTELDIEWTIKDNQLYLLQVRPITTRN